MTDVVDVLGAVADHRLTILAFWIAPAVIVLWAPEDLVTPLLIGLMGAVLILAEAQGAYHRRSLRGA